MIGFLQVYGVTFLGISFTSKLFPWISHRHPTTLRHRSTAHCMALHLKYTLSMTPSLRYLTNVIYEFILSHIFIEHLLGARCRKNRL